MSLTPSRGSRIFSLPCEDFENVAVAEKHVLARYFAGIHDVLRSHGADPDELISSFDIDPGAFQQPTQQIPCAQALPLVEECSFKLDIPYLGLELAACQGVDAYGYVSILCRTAPNLQSALEAFASYVPLTVSPEGVFEILESQHYLEIRWDCDSGLRQNLQGNLHGAAIMLRLLADIAGTDFRPACVNLPQVWRGKHGETLSTRLGCPVRFPSKSYGGLLISKDTAKRPLLHSNRFAFHVLERPLALLKQRIEGDISARVRSFIRSHIGSPDCTAEECAAALSSSVRTLQKQLARAGTSFSAMLDCERCEMAKAALMRSTVSLDELAMDLGYAEQSTFSRAFRRWTGLSPGEFRRSARQRNTATS